MRIKPGASIKGAQAELAIMCLVVDRTFEKYGLRSTLTEGTGGNHMIGSLHPKGLAGDFRDRDLTETQKTLLVLDLNMSLGNTLVDGKWIGEFDVVLEDTHVHVEYDPK